MSNSPLGIGCFRSTFNVAARSVSQSYVRPFASTSARAFSTSRHASVTTQQRREIATIYPIARQLLRSQTPPSSFGSRTFRILPGHPVFANYVDLPPDYEDVIGLPFRRTDLDIKEAKQIFGPKVDATYANLLLRILHGRRVAGTLDDPELQRDLDKLFKHAHQKKALQWLRANVPVDEVANSGLRAEDELAALERENMAEDEGVVDEAEQAKVKDLGYASRFKIYKSEGDKKDVYGTGVFDKIRAYNQARAEELKKRQEEERKKREEEEAKGVTGVPAKFDASKPRQPSPQMQNYIEAAQSDLKEPPKMTKWDRLAPSAVFALLVVGIMMAYAEYYLPPEPAQRIYRDMPASVATIGVIIAANVAVFLAWRIPPLWPLLNRYFIIVPATPRSLSLLGAMFSHQQPSHLLSNIVFLSFLGVQLHEEFGRGDFLATYFGCGILGGFGSLTAIVLRNRLDLTSLGLSSAWYGITAAYFWVHRFDGFKVLGLPPDPYTGVPGLAWIALLLANNIGIGFSARGGGMDIMGHMAGLFAGILAGQLLIWQRERKQRLAEEKAKFSPEDYPIEEVKAPADWMGLGLFGYMLKCWTKE